MEFVNLTSHDVVIYPEDKEPVRIPPSGTEARVQSYTSGTGVVRIRKAGPLVGLPEAKEGVLYIASSMVVAKACANGRTDVVAPACDVRSQSGRIIGASHFVREPVAGEAPIEGTAYNAEDTSNA